MKERVVRSLLIKKNRKSMCDINSDLPDNKIRNHLLCPLVDAHNIMMDSHILGESTMNLYPPSVKRDGILELK